MAEEVAEAEDVGKEEEGATMVEYALLVVMIAMIAMVALRLTGTAISQRFVSVANTVATAS